MVSSVTGAADRTVVYTDGACRGTPVLAAGLGCARRSLANGFDPDTTNQRMELMAVLDALRTIEGPVEVVSDSTYVVNCFRDGWWKGWLKRGWKNSKKPVANRDIWEPLIDLTAHEEETTFTWVKSHAVTSTTTSPIVWRWRHHTRVGDAMVSAPPTISAHLTRSTQVIRSGGRIAAGARRRVLVLVGADRSGDPRHGGPAAAAWWLQPQPGRRRGPPPDHRDPRGQGGAPSGSRRRDRSPARCGDPRSGSGGKGSCRSSPCCRSLTRRSSGLLRHNDAFTIACRSQRDRAARRGAGRQPGGRSSAGPPQRLARKIATKRSVWDHDEPRIGKVVQALEQVLPDDAGSSALEHALQRRLQLRVGELVAARFEHGGRHAATEQKGPCEFLAETEVERRGGCGAGLGGRAPGRAPW